ncbi:hypothetical protein R5R35_008187 [Gryllus longicercus]|uniref:Meiotic nuclear division protein 1 homolog n=1 Tax=Gryllus longicercus TaxID=2509291 RepID=A0AAN9VQJ9_9ORTH|nr:Meiotic nuclear division protein 1 homolog [Gryllus bimaculatus]
MSKRKGVSAEEKRIRMLQIFHEKQEFFQLKELEKIAPKEKGIIAQSVKDVVQSLVDEGLVDTDKIGTSVYYWAYPSKAQNTKKRKLDDTASSLEEKTKKLQKVKEDVKNNQALREDTPQRKKLLEDLARLKAEEAKLQQDIQVYKDNDPEVLEKMKTEIQVAKDAANRWTDNIFAVKSWCKNKFSMEESTLDKHFGIDPEMDYID